MKARVRGESYTHQQLWRTAQHFRREGGGQAEASFHALLAASVFAFCAVEALMNELLRQLDPFTYEREREFFARGTYQGTLGKLHYVAERCEFPLDPSRRPYQSVKTLQVARDRLVHARTEVFEESVPVEKVRSVARRPSVLDGLADKSRVDASFHDLEILCDGLVERARERHGVKVGSAGGAFSGVDSAWDATAEQDPPL